MSGLPILLGVALLGAQVGPSAAGTQAGAAIAITGGTVHTGTGEVLEGATVLLEGGRIVAVGADVRVPAGARRVDAAGKVVTPGLIDLNTQVGLVEVSQVSDTRDGSLAGDPIRSAFRVTDGVNPLSTVIPLTRVDGVTTVLAVPGGGLISGQSALLDLDGWTVEAMTAKAPAAMHAVVGRAALDEVGGSRGGVFLKLREVLDDARFYAQNRANFNRGASRDLAAHRLDLEALLPVLDRSLPIAVRADRTSDILATLRLAREYNLRLVLVSAAQGWMVADPIAAAGVPVILQPLADLPYSFDEIGARLDNAALLARAGVRVALSSFDTHNARNVRQSVGNAIAYGLPYADGLKSVTLTPAQILGVADGYGSLAPGKVANVVVWSGDPFELTTFAEHVFIRGIEVPDHDRQKALTERYRTLDGLPPMYH
jgi:imidazolonepropionase-like amidohydrolase